MGSFCCLRGSRVGSLCPVPQQLVRSSIVTLPLLLGKPPLDPHPLVSVVFAHLVPYVLLERPVGLLPLVPFHCLFPPERVPPETLENE